jgi:phosphomannomutase
MGMAHDSELIVSVSGIRGIIGASLMPEQALAFAAALGTSTQGGRIVLSRDGRPSGAMLRHAVLAGLLSVGCEVHDLGVAATGTVGLAVVKLQASGGIQITASHNPAPWNGLKLFGNNGQVLTAAEGQRIQSIFTRGQFRHLAWSELGTETECREAGDWHCRRVLELVDVTRIRSRHMRTFLDANGGAGGPLGRQLLESLDAQPVCHGCSADGIFEHEPEPVEANLRGIGPLVAAAGAGVGFALDPDADRLALIDETGRYIGEELTLALAVLFRLGQVRGPVVINMSTSRLVEDIARKLGCPCHRASVGEANVAEKMREVDAVIGGEGNGGVMDPRVGLVRDPFIGMGLILSLMADTGRKLSELVAELPAYTIVKDKYTIDRSRLSGRLASLEKQWPGATLDRLDGLRLDWPDHWVHVRPSNTEPIVRVIAESPRREEAEHLCAEVGRLLNS